MNHSPGWQAARATRDAPLDRFAVEVLRLVFWSHLAGDKPTACFGCRLLGRCPYSQGEVLRLWDLRLGPAGAAQLVADFQVRAPRR